MWAVGVVYLLLPAYLLTGVLAAKGKEPKAPRTELSHHCSRTVSRNVRKQLEKEILKVASKAGYDQFPPGCPLDPALDKYGTHEKQKQRKRGGGGNSGSSWTCGICGKSFKNEHYIDLHLENRHMNETPTNSVCLADYCEMFENCEGDSKYKRRRESDEFKCDADELKHSRKRCESAMARCFPVDQEASRSLHAQFSRHWCQGLDCRIREEKWKEHQMALMPVVVLLLLLFLVCFVVFCTVVCCVDNSDDIFQFMIDSGVASNGFVKKCIKAREQTREATGMERTKAI